MSKRKPINKTAARLGAAMYHARHNGHISRNELAMVLCVMPDELAKYEHGVEEIPMDVLEHLFVMAYKMLRVRSLESRYRSQRQFFYKLRNAVNEMP